MSGQRMLSEPEAWRRIAQRLATSERDSPGFLCIEVDRARLWRPFIDEPTSDAMRRRLKRHLGRRFSAYPEFEDRSRVQRQCRVLAALWLALESEHDARSVGSSLEESENNA